MYYREDPSVPQLFSSEGELESVYYREDPSVPQLFSSGLFSWNLTHNLTVLSLYFVTHLDTCTDR